MREYARTYSSATYVPLSRVWGYNAVYPVIGHELGLLPPGGHLDRARVIVAQHLAKERGLVVLDGLDETPCEDWWLMVSVTTFCA